MPTGYGLQDKCSQREDEQLEKIKRGELLEQKPAVKEARKEFKIEESSDEEIENFQEAREKVVEEADKDTENNAEAATNEASTADTTVTPMDISNTTANASENSQTLASPEKFKANQRIEFKDNGKWERVVVLGQAGKKVGKYKHWYNVQLDCGKQFSADFSRQEVRKETEPRVEDQEEAYEN